ncbi:MAG: hypothetical protein FD167_736 [bacterium]|nr:MAG: hypothetical protein FD167_736 [bacterium]
MRNIAINTSSTDNVKHLHKRVFWRASVRVLKQFVVLTFIFSIVIFFAAAYGVPAFQKAKSASKPIAGAKPLATPAPTADPTAKVVFSGKYDTKFNHLTISDPSKPRKAHDVLLDAANCEKCHSKVDNRPENLMPYHDSCIQCHTNQFTDTKLELCVGCHTRPYNENPKVVTFTPVLKQFGMDFSHFSHSTRPGYKCEDCHATPPDGKTARSSMPRHKECYTCHTFENKPAKSGCYECHAIGVGAEKYRTRGQIDFAYKYFKFNHGVHLQVGKQCAECHDVNSSDAAKDKTDISRITLVLSKDINKVHKSTCFKCHDKTGNENTGTPQCQKCHALQPGELVNNPPAAYFKAAYFKKAD